MIGFGNKRVEAVEAAQIGPRGFDGYDAPDDMLSNFDLLLRHDLPRAFRRRLKAHREAGRPTGKPRRPTSRPIR